MGFPCPSKGRAGGNQMLNLLNKTKRDMKKTYLKPEIDTTVIVMNAIMEGSNQTLDNSGTEYGNDDVNAKGFDESIWPE